MTGRFVLVTGSSRGIGRATCLRLARRGMSVLAGVRNSDDGAAIERESGGRIQSVRLDIGCDESIAQAAASIRTIVGTHGLFGLVNNAAGGGRGTPIEYVTRDDLERAFGVTAFGTFLVTRALLPLIRNAQGRIVNVGAGRLPLPLLGAAFGAKFAMEAMTDILRVEIRGRGVKISIVEPGMTRWEDTDEQLAVYGQALDDGLADVPRADRAHYERAVEHFKVVNRRMMATAAPADRVAKKIERALTVKNPRARYHCGYEQTAVAWMERLTTERIRDAIVGRMLGL